MRFFRWILWWDFFCYTDIDRWDYRWDSMGSTVVAKLAERTHMSRISLFISGSVAPFFPSFSRCQGMRTWAWKVTWKRSPAPEARILRKRLQLLYLFIDLSHPISSYWVSHPISSNCILPCPLLSYLIPSISWYLLHLSLSTCIGERPEVPGSFGESPALRQLHRLIHNTYTYDIYIYIYIHIGIL